MIDNNNIGMPKMIDNINLRVRDDLEEPLQRKAS